MIKFINRNFVILIKKVQVFFIVVDNQNIVIIQVYEGERFMIKDNYFFGKFDLIGIFFVFRGVSQIEVIFEIDVNGILRVLVEDKGIGNKEKIIIINDQNRLFLEDIERMVNDVEKFVDDDKKVKERVEVRNELESYIYLLKNQVGDKEKFGGKFFEEDKEIINKVVEDKIFWFDKNVDVEVEDYKK